MIDVVCTVQVYETNERTILPGDLNPPILMLCSHWDKSSLVVINVEGKKYTVNGDDLRRAAINVMNTK